jgi:LacI family transcriptional regulator
MTGSPSGANPELDIPTVVGGSAPSTPNDLGVDAATDAKGAQPPGKTITMAQIAKAAGVSQGAISSLLNDRDYGIRVSEKTRERVFRVCRELGYVPNDLRAVVRMYPERGDLCLLVSTAVQGGLANPFVALVADTLLGNPDSQGVDIVRMDPNGAYPDGDTLPSPLLNGTASKYVSVGPPSPNLLRQITRRGYPVVSLGTEYTAPGVLSVLPDYSQGVSECIGALHKAGHRQIIVLSGPFGGTDPRIVALDRTVAQAFTTFGLSLTGDVVVHGNLDHRAGVQLMEHLRGRLKRPSAVFSFSEAAAAGILSASGPNGIKVPEDLSLVCIADEGGTSFTAGHVSGVALPACEMARSAIESLEAYFRQTSPTVPDEGSKLLVPMPWRPGKTVDAPSPGT